MVDPIVPVQVSVQVCFAPPATAAPVMIDLQVAHGTTLGAAISQSGVVLQMGGVDPFACKLGIWSKLRPAETILRDRDRVEIYRPLIAEPKEARRRRAEKKAGEKT